MIEANDLLKKVRENDQEEEYVPFYTISYAADGEEIRRVKIDYVKLINVLKGLGFRRLDIGNEKFIVRIQDNVVEESSEEDVIDVFEEHLRSYGDHLPDGVVLDKLLDKVYSGLSSYFSTRILHRLKDPEPIEFNVHTKEAAYFYFQNGYVEVTQYGAQLLPYSKLHKKIWRNQILDRKYKEVPAEEYEHSCFYKFVRNIANAWREHPDGRKNEPDHKRFEAFKGIIGYLLHSYFEGKLRAAIFTDSRISDDASGRTGKTLIMKALGHILNAKKHSKTYVEINGKDFDTGERFKYQNVGLDTKLLHINDAQRGLNIEDLFNDITEGISRQRKNEAPTQVYTKMALSTNRTIRIHGDSAKDRTIEFEMADYYSADLSPEMEFKQWFFRDWDNREWQQFDNFLMHCVAVYLKNGLIAPDAINLRIRKLQEETSTDFVKWMEFKKLEHEKRYNKKDMYRDFMLDHTIEGYNDYSWLKKNTFTKWLKLFSEFHPDYCGCNEVASNGQYFIEFHRVGQKVAGNEDIPEGW